MRELDRRLARYKSGPGELLSLDELQKKIESRNGIILENIGEV
jgi:hypothetical protein